MADYPYVVAPNKIRALVDAIQDRGVPPKVTTIWLEAAGFTSKNDRRFIPLLKFLNVLDSNGAPLEGYHAIRSGSRSALGGLIQHAYADLYEALPNAHARSREQLGAQMKAAVPQVNADTVARMVGTFQALAELADFDGAALPAATPAPANTTPQLGHHSTAGGAVEVQPPIAQIAIQIQIDPSMSAEQIDQVFASMAKHIYGRDVS
ncbi:MAG: DUF5343 domain-containing protein [Vicinamibacterales bacterium]